MDVITIDLFKEDFKFSAGHFTVFSASERERLHGHNFQVRASFTVAIDENGMAADYNHYKDKIRDLCSELDEYFLLPEHSPYLTIKPGDRGRIIVLHADDELIFYEKDVLLLPIRNTTIEELCIYLRDRISNDEAWLLQGRVQSFSMKVASGHGQMARVDCYPNC